MSDDQFFGPETISFDVDDGNNDIFGTVQDVKQPPIQKKQEPKQKDLVQQHKEDTEINGFDAGFDDNFGNFGDFGDNKDLAITDDNAGGGGGGGGGFGGDWNTNFDE